MNTLNTVGIFFKRLRSRTHQDPVRDWLAMITIAAIALAGTIVWNAWAFDTVANGGVIGTAAIGPLPTFSRASLDTIHTIFANRAAEEAKYATGTYRYNDPSQ